MYRTFAASAIAIGSGTYHAKTCVMDPPRRINEVARLWPHGKEPVD